MAVMDPTKFLDKLMHSPSGRKLIDDATRESDAALAARRKELVAELERVNTEHLRAVTGLNEAVQQALERNKAAWDALKASESVVRAANAARSSASSRHGRGRDLLEYELRETASGEIATLTTELGQAREAAMRNGHRTRSWSDWTGRQHSSSNHESVSAHLMAIRDALESAEALKLEHLDPKALAARIKTIRGSIPAIAAAAGPPDAKEEA